MARPRVADERRERILAAFDLSLAAVSRALGSAFLAHMRVQANDPRRLLERTTMAMAPATGATRPTKEKRR